MGLASRRRALGLDSDLAPDKRRGVRTRLLVLERLNGPAGAGGKVHYYGTATEERRYGYAGDANRARVTPT